MLCSGGRFIVKGKDSRVAERGQRLGKEGGEEVIQMRQEAEIKTFVARHGGVHLSS